MPKKSINTRSTVPFDKEVGGRVRSYRNAAGLSQADLGDKLGVTFQQIQKYEEGHQPDIVHQGARHQ